MSVWKSTDHTKTTAGLAFEDWWLLTVGQLDSFASLVLLLP